MRADTAGCFLIVWRARGPGDALRPGRDFDDRVAHTGVVKPWGGREPRRQARDNGPFRIIPCFTPNSYGSIVRAAQVCIGFGQGRRKGRGNSRRVATTNVERPVHRGGKHLDASVATAIAMHVLDEGLTEREIAVLSLAAWGNSNKRIAARLAISEETVKGHMKLIFAKLGAVDRTHAVTLAARRGLIEL